VEATAIPNHSTAQHNTFFLYISTPPLPLVCVNVPLCWYAMSAEQFLTSAITQYFIAVSYLYYFYHDIAILRPHQRVTSS